MTGQRKVQDCQAAESKGNAGGGINPKAAVVWTPMNNAVSHLAGELGKILFAAGGRQIQKSCDSTHKS